MAKRRTDYLPLYLLAVTLSLCGGFAATLAVGMIAWSVTSGQSPVGGLVSLFAAIGLAVVSSLLFGMREALRYLRAIAANSKPAATSRP